MQDVETWNHNGISLKARIALPDGDGPFPVVMAIHGGAFSGGDRNRFENSFFKHYTDMGIAVMSIEYRLTANNEGGQHPRAIQDCMHNLHWLRDHADDYNFDTTRVALQGSSAGSYLAMMLALTCRQQDFQPDFGPYQHKKATVAAVISCAAMYDWTAISNGGNYISGSRHDPAASPVNLAAQSACPAFLLLGGANDTDWSPPQPAHQMQDSLQQHGVYCELHLKPNHGHPGFYGTTDEFSAWAWERVDPFVEKYLIQANTRIKKNDTAEPEQKLKAVPNPCNPQTTIMYDLNKSQRVTISIYSTLGQKIATLVDAFQSSGHHAIHWSGSDDRGARVASGLYFIHCKTAQSAITHKIIVMQ